MASMVVGATLINTSHGREQIAKTLANSERPFYFVLLVFAGASWQPSGMWWWWAPVAVFLVMRVAAKVGTARLAARANDMLPVVGPDWGRALVGQGGLALAIALDYGRFRGTMLPNVVFSAAVASLVLTDVMSARVINSVITRLIPRRRLRGGRGGGGGEDAGGAAGTGAAGPEAADAGGGAGAPQGEAR